MNAFRVYFSSTNNQAEWPRCCRCDAPAEELRAFSQTEDVMTIEVWCHAMIDRRIVTARDMREAKSASVLRCAFPTGNAFDMFRSVSSQPSRPMISLHDAANLFVAILTVILRAWSSSPTGIETGPPPCKHEPDFGDPADDAEQRFSLLEIDK